MLRRYFRVTERSVALLVLVVLAAIGVTVDAAVKSAHYTSIGCHTYADRGGEMERCQGLYTLERTWDEAAATCETDGWTGLALADTHQVETALGQFMMLKNDEIDADNGYRAWIGGREVDDRVWKWSDGTTFQRERMKAASVAVNLTDDEKKFENCAELSVDQAKTTMTLASRMCRTMLKFFICQLNDTSTSAAGNETTAGCQLNGTAGVRVNKSCYAAFPGSVIESKATWSAGVASWYKANGFCHSIGANLATLGPAVVNSSSTKTLVDYLAGVSPTGPFWVGLARKAWVWVEEYDEGSGKPSRTSPTYYSDWLEPDQPNKERMDCMSIGGNDGRYGWSNERCERRLAFVCENRTLTLTTAMPETTTAAFNASHTNTTAGTHQAAGFSLASRIIIICIVVVAAILVLSLGVFWCIRLRRRDGYSPQP